MKTKTVELCWREIFDIQTLKIFNAGVSIEDVNAYINTCTHCKYFLFNGRVFESHRGYFDKVNVEIIPDKNLPLFLEHL